MGQGVSTLLPQILADELGADWRTIGVQSAPIGPLYANVLLAREWLANDWSRLAGEAGEWTIDKNAISRALMLPGAGTSVPMRSEERLVGKAWVITGRYWVAPVNKT